MINFIRSREMLWILALMVFSFGLLSVLAYYENSERVTISDNLNKGAVSIDCVEFTSIIDKGGSCYKSRGYLAVKQGQTTTVYDPISRVNVATIITGGWQTDIKTPWNKASTEAFWNTFSN